MKVNGKMIDLPNDNMQTLSTWKGVDLNVSRVYFSYFLRIRYSLSMTLSVRPAKLRDPR